jgi:hypothetical protein
VERDEIDRFRASTAVSLESSTARAPSPEGEAAFAVKQCVVSAPEDRFLPEQLLNALDRYCSMGTLACFQTLFVPISEVLRLLAHQ